MEIVILKQKIGGEITVPASKSQTIRALLIATFAKNPSTINNPLFSEDTQSCIDICKKLGAEIKITNQNNLLVTPLKRTNTKEPLLLDCHNSGTTMYLATALCASLERPITFTGDEQLRNRPVLPLLNCLRDLGVKVEGDTVPYTITGPITGGQAAIICKTSQYLSSLLLGCPLAKEKCVINVPLLYEKPYVNITLTYLDHQNIKYKRTQDLQHFSIEPNQSFDGIDITIDGDFSSASFFFGAAAITKSTITVRGLNPNDPQGDKSILRILSAMGCKVSWQDNSVTVRGPGVLKGGTFDLNSMPDTLPILSVVGAFAKGETHLINVPQARIKETDRIATMHKNLSALGIQVQEQSDGLSIYGNGGNDIEGTILDGYQDHRIIMALAILGLKCKSLLTIKGADRVEVTFPTFFELLQSLRKGKYVR